MSFQVIHGLAEMSLPILPESEQFDLVVTSPPYNLSKDYERGRLPMGAYVAHQALVIEECWKRLKPTGSICWQVGNYVPPDGGCIEPLDVWLTPIFWKLGAKLRNRIVWSFGHGEHCQNRFSHRHESVLWFTKSDEYFFNLDAVRMPQKYPNKKAFKGKNKGKLSCNPMGKNPSDVWDNIPNVKSNHVEKTAHPCQFPVGLIERLVLALTPEGGRVLDPFAGVCSTGVACLVHGREFLGIEAMKSYIDIAVPRLEDAQNGRAKYRAHDKPIYEPVATGPEGDEGGQDNEAG